MFCRICVYFDVTHKITLFTGPSSDCYFHIIRRITVNTGSSGSMRPKTFGYRTIQIEFAMVRGIWANSFCRVAIGRMCTQMYGAKEKNSRGEGGHLVDSTLILRKMLEKKGFLRGALLSFVDKLLAIYSPNTVKCQFLTRFPFDNNCTIRYVMAINIIRSSSRG